MGSFLVRRSAVKKWLSLLYSSALLGLCLPLANDLVSFSIPDLSWDTPLGMYTPFSQYGYQNEGFWEEQTHYAWHYPLTFDPQEPFCTSIVSPLSPKRREWRSLNPVLK